MRSRHELPLYNTALGPADTTLVVSPPFNFPGVIARVFPLRASMNVLRGFCDHYLNVAPEVCELHPYLPYVLLMVLDYGRMAIEEFNLGWVSQHEVLFEVPLAMWRRDRTGRPFREKWVVSTPFILVDNACSLTTGRESYGWPKVLAKLRSSPEHWLRDPRNPSRFLTLDVRGPSADDSDSRLLVIEQQSGQSSLLDFERLDPFGRLSRLSRTSLTIGSDLAQLLLRSPLSGFRPRRGAAGGRGALFDGLRQLLRFVEEPGVDVVTLKQFRDSEDPTQICYQALVESRLSVARYNRGGLLGLDHVLQGDPSGGFSIRLYDNPAFPIAASLGLEVAQQRKARGRTVSVLEPFFPFWMSVDLTYGKGKTICWRTRKDPWHVQGTRVGRSAPKKVYFNTIAGGAEQVWYGPYYNPEASYAIYPLEARVDTLREFLNRYLSIDPGLRFELLTEEVGVGEEKQERAYVYLLASRNQMFSKARSGKHIEASQIYFNVPLRLDPGGENQTDVLATPFAFVDNPVLAITIREVEGIPAVNASIEAPSRFLRRQGPLLQMRLDVFESLGAGMPSQRRTVLEVWPGEKIPPAELPDDASEVVASEAFGARGFLGLKQFRDAEQPDRACYQSLVLEPWDLHGREPEVTYLKRKLRIHIYRYPSLPLVETLGLVATETLPPREPGGAVADVLQVEQPFRIKMGLEVGLGKEISRTAG